MQRLINLGLLISSLFVYLEWPNQSAFLLQIEYGLFFNSNSTVESFAHPLILLPLLGQLLLLVALFKKPQNFRLTFIGMGLLNLLILFILFVGLVAWNLKIIFSAVPFVLISILAIVYYRKMKKRMSLPSIS